MKKANGIRKLVRYNAVILALFLVVCTGAVLIILYRANAAGLERQIEMLSESVADDVDYKVLNISRFSSQIFLNAEFQEALKHLDDADNQQYYEAISNIFAQMVTFSSLIVDVYFWPFDDGGGMRFDNYIIQGSTAVFMTDKRESFEAFAAAPENRRGKLGIVTRQGDMFMAFTRVVTGMLDDNYLKPVGLGAVIVNVNALFESVNDMEVTGAAAGIADAQMNAVFAGGIESSVEGGVFVPQGKSVAYPLENFGWKLLTLYNAGTVWSTFGGTAIAFIAEMLLLMCLFSLCMLLFNYFHSKQYYLFQETFRKIEAGDLRQKMPYGKDAEINKVAERFNSMMDAINDLNSQVVDAEVASLQLKLEKNEYLLKYLNSQINKHFMFNTFGLIRAFVNTGKSKKASSCIDSMCEVMRYTLSTKDIVLLREELDSLAAYLRIQTLRRPGIAVTMEIAEDCLDVRIPKFILQPIVENCYAHGFSGEKGTIAIRAAQQGEMLRIEVQDDGCGVPAHKLEALRANLLSAGAQSGSDGIALRNIDRRLRIVPSAQGTLELDSEEGKGFKVTVLVRIVQGEETDV